MKRLQLKDAINDFLGWLESSFINISDSDHAITEDHAGAGAQFAGRIEVYDKFIEWENDHGGSPSSFSYPHEETSDEHYPYLINIQKYIKDALYSDTIVDTTEGYVAHIFHPKEELNFEGKKSH